MTDRRRWLALIGGLTLVTLLVGWGANRYLIDQKVEQASHRLELLSNLRRGALERYFDTAEAELRFWAARQDLIAAQQWLNTAWVRAEEAGSDPEQRLQEVYITNNPYPAGERRKLDKPDYLDSEYVKLHARLHPLARKFVEERFYYDFFLISPAGNIHYSVEKEADFATNLNDGPYRDTGLAEAYRRALDYADSDDVAVSDMQAYSPSNGAPAMFIAKTMHDEQGTLLGVIALQLPTDRIVQIMDFNAGMGKTGETYVVGQDLLMRSESRFGDESTILSQVVDTVTTHRALQGEYGVDFTEDYRGEVVLSAYSSAVVDTNTWAVMAEIDRAEILENATSNQPLLAGLMLFFYSLALWSVWFVGRAGEAADSATLLGDLDLDGGLDLSDG